MVACVLKSGGIYGPQHVERLRRQVDRHAPDGTVFACLTDVGEEMLGVVPLVIRLRRGWPGWWSKMELFRLGGPVLYLDLDVTITGDLTPLAEAAMEHEFIACGNFWSQDLHHKINSSVMAWRGDASALHRAFLDAGPEEVMRAYTTPQEWGDQAFIRDHLAVEPALWQDVLPGSVMSYKRDVMRGKPTGDCKVIVYHGDPKPWDLERAA